ncbi:MAG: OmpA family protein [Bacteroidales bacterium]|nr:OmpA family protein [Bacteroidales bacterium]
MRIRILLFTLIFSLAAFPVFAQNRVLRVADDAFNNMQYNVALTKYKKALSKAKAKPDKEKISFQMAECYRIINNTKKAESAYKRLAKTKYAQTNPLVFLHLAEAMKSNEKYTEAKTYFEKYTELVPADPRGPTGSQSCKLAQDWIDTPTKLKIKLEKALNSKESDFSTTYSDKLYNTIIFTSTRDASTGKDMDNWTGQNFSDLFVSKLDPKGQWSTPVQLETGNIINTEANEGNPAVNSKFNQMYFTRCSNDKGTLQGCKIMVSRRAGRNWGEPVALDLGGDSTTVFGNPSISPDELTLVFTSNLPHGEGGKDIWVSTRKTSGENFGRPLNAGPVINTPDDEMFPFMRNDTSLYFSSNGLPGLGGLDIFRCTFSNGVWTKPVNLQVPVNSPGDDFAIVFNPEDDKGFFSSNRKGGRGSDDIYSFVNPPVIFTLAGVVKDDKTLQFIQGAVVKLTGSNGTSIEARTDAKGFYNFNKAQIKPNTTYELICLKANYLNKKAKETTVGLESSKDFTIDFKLEPIPDKPVVLPDILYDLAKWDLKPQYQDSLQGLIKTLDENETIIIELASHTDSRGTDESNDVLSQKRAESVVNYLIERGIDPDRLVAKGYGERVPRRLAKDVTKDGFQFKAGTLLSQSFIDSLSTKPAQEAAYSLNRRSEFRIISKDFVPKTQNQVITSQLPVKTTPTQTQEKAIPGQTQDKPIPNPIQDKAVPNQLPDKVTAIQPQKVVIQINPDDNVVPLSTNPDNTLSFSAVVNGYTTQITLSEEGPGLSFSVDATLKMLKSGAIGKTDFAGDAEKILGNNSVADKSIFSVGEINITTKSAFDLEATVLQKQKSPVLMSEKVLKRFGTYTIDKEKKQIIFKK